MKSVSLFLVFLFSRTAFSAVSFNANRAVESNELLSDVVDPQADMVYVGEAEFLYFDIRQHDDAETDKLMNDACNNAYPGSIAGDTYVITHHELFNIPENLDHEGKHIVPLCPECTGPEYYNAVSHHYRLCVPSSSTVLPHFEDELNKRCVWGLAVLLCMRDKNYVSPADESANDWRSYYGWCNSYGSNGSNFGHCHCETDRMFSECEKSGDEGCAYALPAEVCDECAGETEEQRKCNALELRGTVNKVLVASGGVLTIGIALFGVLMLRKRQRRRYNALSTLETTRVEVEIPVTNV